MKQITVKKGKIINEEVSSPRVESGFLLIKTAFSCISAGTEVAGIQRSKMHIVKRAFEKPEKLQMALDLLKKHGISTTLKQIKDINDTGFSSGYSVSGKVIDLGIDIKDFKIGDRVAAAGGGYAIHAEHVLVPKNLVAKIPDEVPDREAAVATIGAIALHGVHRANLILGEKAVVIGCGLIGLITVQLLKASGIQVVAIDVSPNRIQMAKELGADLIFLAKEENLSVQIKNWSDGEGVDAVLFTAATSNSEALSEGFKMCRRKGRLVLVGVSGMEINRKDIYPNEIDFLISTSYGPGRYDKNYEEGGQDYPYAYVRWTENRNIQEFLRLLKQKIVNIEALIDEEYTLEKSSEAFASLQKEGEKPLIVLLRYPEEEGKQDEVKAIPNIKGIKGRGKIRIGLIGTGNFMRSVHIPNLYQLKDKYQIRGVVSRKGLDSKTIAKQNGAEYASTDPQEIFKDPEIDLVFIATRHDSHAELSLAALKADKHVFVEKPLAIYQNELDAIKKIYSSGETDKYLMVGFNRRFSKYAQEIKRHTSKRINPLFIRYRMNAGYLPPDHWVYKTGGRIIGEACHIIDLMNFLTESEIVEVSSASVTPQTGYFFPADNKSFTIKYKDGSLAAIDYFSCGNSKLPKEYMEIHFDQKSIELDNYTSLKGHGLKLKNLRSSSPDKGLLEELIVLHDYLSGEKEEMPISPDNIFQTTQATLLIDSSR